MALKATDDAFIGTWLRLKSPAAVAKAFGLDIRQVYSRRTKIEEKYCIRLDTEDNRNSGRPKVEVPKIGFRAIQDNIVGRVIIGSDMHAWPGERSTAFGAMVEVIKDQPPAMVIINGDSLDGGRISRHPPLPNAVVPTVIEELDAAKERLAEIESVAPVGCPLVHPLGNHDLRYGMTLTAKVPEYRGVNGFDLADHFPAWELCMSIWLNQHTVVKHRHANGVHGAYNNVLKSGKNIVTGHTHRLQSAMYSDYNGLRWGIECGTLSDFGPENDKYLYAEDGPMNWSQGFSVLTFAENGMLLEPEFCRVLNGVAYFRGEVIYSKSELKAA